MWKILKLIFETIVGIWFKFGKSKIERLEEKAQIYKDLHNEAVAKGDMPNTVKYDRLWRRMSAQIARNRRK